MLTIDTNVMMYDSGDEHPLREPCARIIALIAEGRLEAMTTPEAIQEFAYIYARRRGRQAAVRIANQYVELLGAFDAILAAVALDTKYATVVSADRAFATIPGITHVFPDAEGIASLIE